MNISRQIFLPGVEKENSVGQKLDLTPADAESATFKRMGDEAKVEKVCVGLLRLHSDMIIQYSCSILLPK